MNLNRLYFFLTLLVIVISGNPVIAVLGKETVYIGSLLIFLIAWFFTRVKLIRLDFVVVGFFVFLSVAHVINFGELVIAASLGFLIKVCIGLLAVRVIPDFAGRYVGVMYWLSLISFVFFIPLYFGVDMRGIFSSIRISLPLDSIHYHIGLHNLREEYEGNVRNMGMFWEPGAFAGYLVLALFFMVRDGRNGILRSKQGVIILIALLTTQSTAGYLALFALLVLYANSIASFRSKATKIIVLPMLLLVLMSLVVLLFSQVSFLGEKISGQIDSVTIGEDSSRINRFGNILYDLDWISDRPILGWSANPETRLALDPEALDLAAGQGNGLTGFAVKFGIFGILLFFAAIAYATYKKSGSTEVAVFGVITVALLLNGEQFLMFPVFLSLMFLPLVGKVVRNEQSKHQLSGQRLGSSICILPP